MISREKRLMPAPGPIPWSCGGHAPSHLGAQQVGDLGHLIDGNILRDAPQGIGLVVQPQLTHGHPLLDLGFVDAVAGRQPGGGQQIDLAAGEPFKIGFMGGVAAGDPVAPLLQNGSHQGPGHAVE